MTRYLFIIVFILANLNCFSSYPLGIIINNDSTIIYDTTNIRSKIIGYLQAGETVDILDTTINRFEIGTWTDSLCNLFPFVKIQNNNGKLGWVSGQFIYKIIENPKEYTKSLIRTTTNFSLNKHQYSLSLGENYGIGASNEQGLTGCEENYPILIFDKSSGKYFLIENLENPNSKNKFCCLIYNEGIVEELKKIEVSGDTIIFKIGCAYQMGICTYDTNVFFSDKKFYGKSANYTRTNE
jgi:hypothetical protein